MRTETYDLANDYKWVQQRDYKKNPQITHKNQKEIEIIVYFGII